MADEGNFVEVDGYTLPGYFDVEKIKRGALHDWKCRGDDVIIGGFPKSGNTWLIKILQSMYSDWGLCEFGGRREPVLLEEYLLGLPITEARVKALESTDIDDLPSPRLMRTHLPAAMLPLRNIKEGGAKVIYVSRNPKDVCVSAFHFFKVIQPGDFSAGNWEQSVQGFMRDKVPFAPWSKHVIGWFDLGVNDNVLHVTYEDMKADLPEIIRKIAGFLGRPINEADIERVVAATSVETMRQTDPLDIMYIDGPDAVIPKGQNPGFAKESLATGKDISPLNKVKGSTLKSGGK